MTFRYSDSRDDAEATATVIGCAVLAVLAVAAVIVRGAVRALKRRQR